MKRVAVFAHYDSHNIIEDYVVYYLQELQKVSEQIVFVSDSELNDAELSKIAPYVVHSIAYHHGEYDFGSYKRGYQWARDNGLLEHCEEFIFANDSCYAPLFPFEDMFSKMSVKDVDFWGATANPHGIEIRGGIPKNNRQEHIQSYFVVFKPQVFKSDVFANFMNSVKKEETKEEIIAYYEVGMTKLLVENGFRWDVYCELSKAIPHSHLSIYRRLIKENKSLFLKRGIALYKFKNNHYPFLLKHLINKYTNYDFNLIYKDKQKNKENHPIYKHVLCFSKNFRKFIIRTSLKDGIIYLLEKPYYIFNKKIDNNHVVYSSCGIKLKKRINFKKNKFETINISFPEWMGLGNRILGLINTIHLVKPKHINIFWSTSSWVTMSLNDLFDLNFDCDINEYNKEIEKKSNTYVNNVTIDIPKPELKTDDGNDISLLYNNLKKEHIDEFIDYFKNIKPSSKIMQRLKDVRLPDDYVALQIRNNFDWDEYGRNENLEGFDKQIEAYPKNTKFYLSAMNKDIADRYIKKYGTQIITLNNKDYSSMIDAVTDLYLLSKANKAIYSYGSTFSELAFWLGGAIQTVSIVGNKEGWN